MFFIIALVSVMFENTMSREDVYKLRKVEKYIGKSKQKVILLEFGLHVLSYYGVTHSPCILLYLLH